MVDSRPAGREERGIPDRPDGGNHHHKKDREPGRRPVGAWLLGRSIRPLGWVHMMDTRERSDRLGDGQGPIAGMGRLVGTGRWGRE